LIAEDGMTAPRKQIDGEGLEFESGSVDVELRSVEPGGGGDADDRGRHRDLL
jgi:hypothetical protein